MTFSHQSDTIETNSIYAAELYGFKNNCRLGVFASNYSGSQVGIKDRDLSGLIRHDVYYATDRWYNPNTGVIEVIPDYNNATWSAAGAAVFSGAVVNTAKATRYPNHGQQLFNISNGQYGYDFTTGTPGLSNQEELINLLNTQNDWLFNLVGRRPAGGSYRNGQTASAGQLLPFWLGCRNSSPGSFNAAADANTFYGLNKQTGVVLGLPNTSVFDRITLANYPSSDRWYDFYTSMGATKAQATAYVQGEIAKARATFGWYRSFFHWHNLAAAGVLTDLDEYLSMCRTAFGGDFVHTCSNGEALEYLFLRSIAKRINTVTVAGKVVVLVDVVDGFKGSNTSGIANDLPLPDINTPLTVWIDLTGTPLAGQNIKSNFGKPVSLGSDQYLIEIPFVRKEETFMVISLESGAGDYLSLAQPTGSGNVSGTTLTVTTNVPTKAVLFEVTTGGQESASTVSNRDNIFSTNHSFTVTSGKDFRVGIINEAGQARLITI